MRNNHLVDGFVVAKDTLEGEGKCINCLLGSAVRRPFDAHVPVESGILEQVHLDLTGPMCTMSRGGFSPYRRWTLHVYQGLLPREQGS